MEAGRGCGVPQAVGGDAWRDRSVWHCRGLPCGHRFRDPQRQGTRVQVLLPSLLLLQVSRISIRAQIGDKNLRFSPTAAVSTWNLLLPAVASFPFSRLCPPTPCPGGDALPSVSRCLPCLLLLSLFALRRWRWVSPGWFLSSPMSFGTWSQ